MFEEFARIGKDWKGLERKATNYKAQCHIKPITLNIHRHCAN
jgi:hypothetical protein